MKHLTTVFFFWIFFQTENTCSAVNYTQTLIPRSQSEMAPVGTHSTLDLPDLEESGLRTPSTQLSVVRNEEWDEQQKEFTTQIQHLQKKIEEMDSHLRFLTEKFDQDHSYKSVMHKTCWHSFQIFVYKIAPFLLKGQYEEARQSTERYLELPHYDEIYQTAEFQKLYPQPIIEITTKKEELIQSWNFLKKITLDRIEMGVMRILVTTIYPFYFALHCPYPDFGWIRNFFLENDQDVSFFFLDYPHETMHSFFEESGRIVGQICLKSLYHTGRFLDSIMSIFIKNWHYFGGKRYLSANFLDKDEMQRSPHYRFRLSDPFCTTVSTTNIWSIEYAQEGWLTAIGSYLREASKFAFQATENLTYRVVETTIGTTHLLHLIAKCYSGLFLTKFFQGVAKVTFFARNIGPAFASVWKREAQFEAKTFPRRHFPLPPSLIAAQKELSQLKLLKQKLEQEWKEKTDANNAVTTPPEKGKTEDQKKRLEPIDEIFSMEEV